MNLHPISSKHHRTLFISDIHLGTKAAQAEALLHFIKHNTADTIYLVGDIVDLWKIRRGVYWPQPHNDVLQKLLRTARKGTRVIFIPGNHDEALRDYCGQSFGSIEVQRNAIHETADGQRYTVMHGDEFDVVVRYAKWLAFIGDRSYELALWSNRPLNWVRRKLGYGYWSLSAHLKSRVKAAVSFIGEYEDNLAEVAKRNATDGVICGHIHQAADRRIGNIRYLNCGDWMESCTAITESHTGELEIVRWQEVMEAQAKLPLPDPVLEAAE